MKRRRSSLQKWTVFAWGGRRDLALVRRLKDRTSLQTLIDSGDAVSRKGLVRASEGPTATLWKYLGGESLTIPISPKGTFLCSTRNRYHRNKDPFTHRMTDLTAFGAAATRGEKELGSRIRKVPVSDYRHKDGSARCAMHSELCKHKCAGRRVRQLESACLSFNSILAAYFLPLTSGRLASYRPEPLTSELFSVPLTPRGVEDIRQIKGYDDLDSLVLKANALKDADWPTDRGSVRLYTARFQGR